MMKKQLLFVFAHPDDESFTSGVTIAKYSNSGAAVALLCATRGQAGSAGDPPLCSPGELPQVREREVRQAAEILGIHSVDVLDYEDKHLTNVPQEELVEKIQQAVKAYQPQIVVTFAPHGISGHPDHHAISQATTAAVKHLPENSPVKKLYYCTIPSTSPMPAGRTLYTDPYETITTEISAPEYIPIAARALLAHRTQHQSVESVFPGITQGDFHQVRHVNHYILAWHNLPEYTVTGKENDFFAGIASP
ncbi:PIG-L family deacetylase [Brevibacillus humidisoli]|uniref:PIG-L deacetylase family protein n=1 Tax=Brevibacillus humidisoli TaxID=2895522 RepID=UPI001E625836|nr:PIG-L family deacetylase [Brevibacillus humidisoli]UFJ42814.1 PIG-L family deacetylase [Brevibacillus humidisoli]